LVLPVPASSLAQEKANKKRLPKGSLFAFGQ